MQVTHARPQQECPEPPNPSYEAQILTLAARVLLLQPGHWTFNASDLNAAMYTAGRAILDNLPKPVQQDARSRVRAALPAIGGQSRGQYAESLRFTAREL